MRIELPPKAKYCTSPSRVLLGGRFLGSIVVYPEAVLQSARKIFFGQALSPIRTREMNVDRQEMAEELQDIEAKLANGNVEPAKQKVRALRERFDVTDVAVSQGDRTIGIEIDIWSYEYEDSIYFVTSDYSSIINAVSDLVSDHIPKLANPGVGKDKTAEATAITIRNSENVVSSASYEKIDLDEEISIHADVYYMRASVHYEGEAVRNITNPGSEEIVESTRTVVERAGEDKKK